MTVSPSDVFSSIQDRYPIAFDDVHQVARQAWAKIIGKAQPMQHPRRIWANLNSRADFAQGVGLFVRVQVETGTKQ